MGDLCSWCGKAIKPGKGKKSYKGKNLGTKVLTFMFGKTFVVSGAVTHQSDRTRNNLRQNSFENGK